MRLTKASVRLVHTAFLFALFLLGRPVLGQTFPIQISASNPGKVYVRSVGQSEDYQEISATVPTVYQVVAGERVDIRVVGKASWWADWVGEQQGRTGPSSVTLRLEKKPAWDRLSLLAGVLALLAGGGVVFWRRAAVRKLAQVERRAELAESGTGIPKRIAHYTIESLLGEGGMAHVYLGHDAQGVGYAIKIPKTVDERFRRECTIASTLESPHIVKAFDFCAEKSQGKPAYMAQEYLVGHTLEARIEGTQGLEFADVDRLMGQLLDGLEVAHGQQILHRDLKPENLFLDRSTGTEVLKILDFGVARAEDELLVTVSGAMLGTAIYSSPEQNRSDQLDQRSDLYSVGLIAYEMLTGRRAWSALNRYELLKMHNAGHKSEVRDLRPDVPESWNQLIAELLSSDPDGRPSTAAEVRRRWREGSG